MKSIKIELSEAQHLALAAKAEELDISPQNLIIDALEVYGALPLDEGFNLKIRAHMRDIFGFSSLEGLEAFVKGLYENYGCSGQPPAIQIQPPQVIQVQPEMVSVGKANPDGKGKALDIFRYILGELESGKEPLVSEVATIFDMNAAVMGRIIGLKTVTKRLKQYGGRPTRVYTKEMIDEIKSKIKSTEGD